MDWINYHSSIILKSGFELFYTSLNIYYIFVIYDESTMPAWRSFTYEFSGSFLRLDNVSARQKFQFIKLFGSSNCLAGQ